MNHADSVRRVERRQHLLRPAHGFLDEYFSSDRFLFERATVEALHEDERTAVLEPVDSHVVDDVRMSESLERFRFEAYAINQLRVVRRLRSQHLGNESVAIANALDLV